MNSDFTSLSNNNNNHHNHMSVVPYIDNFRGAGDRSKHCSVKSLIDTESFKSGFGNRQSTYEN